MTIQLTQQSPDFSKFRPNAGCVIVNKDGNILYCERADIKDAWQMPQGGIDAGEDPQKAALRELFEETAITDIIVKGEYPSWLVYEFPPTANKREGFLGQAQKWFLLEFTGDINNINLENAQDQEFSNYQWATPQYILETVVDFRKEIYAEVFKEFKKI